MEIKCFQELAKNDHMMKPQKLRSSQGKKQRPLLLLREELVYKLKLSQQLCDNVAMVNTAIVMAVVEEIVLCFIYLQKYSKYFVEIILTSYFQNFLLAIQHVSHLVEIHSNVIVDCQ